MSPSETPLRISVEWIKKLCDRRGKKTWDQGFFVLAWIFFSTVSGSDDIISGGLNFLSSKYECGTRWHPSSSNHIRLILHDYPWPVTTYPDHSARALPKQTVILTRTHFPQGGYHHREEGNSESEKLRSFRCQNTIQCTFKSLWWALVIQSVS